MSDNIKMPEPLKDAVARLNWAGQLISELRTLIDEYEVREFERYLPKWDEPQGNYSLELPNPTSFPPPRSIKVLVGDIVDNLRKALEYLVFQLAKNNKGREVTGTQFIVVASAKRFDEMKAMKLKGLKDHQIRIIEEYQPYNGGEWLRLLTRMSNQDKHRELHGVFNRDELEIHFDTSNEEEDYEGWKVFRNVDNHGANVCIRSAEAIVRLADGRPAVETLEVMHEGVGQVLSRFVGEFE